MKMHQYFLWTIFIHSFFIIFIGMAKGVGAGHLLISIATHRKTHFDKENVMEFFVRDLYLCIPTVALNLLLFSCKW